MNSHSLRSASAFARRSLATPPPSIAPLSSSSRLLSSTSFTSSTSSPQRSFSSALRLPRTTRIAASSRWSGSTPSLYLSQSRNMATEGPKIKVKNPVVELDGDEVWIFLPFYSSNSLASARVSQASRFRAFSGGYRPSVPVDAGKHGGGNPLPLYHVSRETKSTRELAIQTRDLIEHDSLDMHCCANRRVLIVDDPYYLARDQGKGKPRELPLLITQLYPLPLIGPVLAQSCMIVPTCGSA